MCIKILFLTKYSTLAFLLQNFRKMHLAIVVLPFCDSWSRETRVVSAQCAYRNTDPTHPSKHVRTFTQS